MNKRLTTLVVLLLLAVGTAPPSADAGPYELAICPILSGHFILQKGELWLTILKQDGQPVAKRTEKIANPLDDRSHEVLAKRGQVQVEVHQHKEGGLFVHWGTLADDKE